jgi:hypothetical protein
LLPASSLQYLFLKAVVPLILAIESLWETDPRSLEPLSTVTKTNPNVHHEKHSQQSGAKRLHERMTARSSVSGARRHLVGASWFDERHTAPASARWRAMVLGHNGHQQTKCSTLARYGARQLDRKYTRVGLDLILQSNLSYLAASWPLSAKLMRMAIQSWRGYQGNPLMQLFFIEDWWLILISLIQMLLPISVSKATFWKK